MLCDWFGIGRLMRLAALGHISGVLLTLFSTDFRTLFGATIAVGVANGLVEAAINPLVVALYRDGATSRLISLHAWFPGGIVIGGALVFALTQLGCGWQAKVLLMLLPSVIYAVMFFGQTFPETGRQAAGVSLVQALRTMLRPLFAVIFLSMWLTAATELGPGQWVSNIFNEVMHSATKAGVLLLVWINGIAYLIRQFGGRWVKHVPSSLLIVGTAPIAAIGLSLFGVTGSVPVALTAAALLAIGTAFWWPTMLAITAEQFPRGGAVALAVVGAAGSFSSAVAGPIMGRINDNYGAAQVLPVWAVLPVVIAIIFASVHVLAKARPRSEALKESSEFFSGSN
jgi:predicted MFS family arabinose efflux permease